jgi:hypothetical protein
MVSFCEDGNECFDSIKGRTFLDHMSDYNFSRHTLDHRVN